MIIEFMLVKSAKNPLGTPQKVETFEDFARIVQNARSTRKNDTKDGPAILAHRRKSRPSRILRALSKMHGTQGRTTRKTAPQFAPL